MLRKIMVSGGVTVVTLSLSALASGYPKIITDHWKWLAIASVAGAIIAAWGYFFLKPPDAATGTNTHGANSPIGGSGTTAGGDVSGDLITAQGSVHKETHYHHYDKPVDTPALPPPTRTIGALSPERKIPRLLIRPVPSSCLSHDCQMISFSAEGEPGMIVSVENPEAGVGEQGIVARDVVAIVRFYHSSGDLAGTSEYAFWLDTFENRVTIQPGRSKKLVIGIYSNPKLWKYFSNRLTNAIPRPVRWSQFQAHAARISVPLEPQLMLMNPIVDAKITLMSGLVTLAKKSFRLSTIENAMGQTINFNFEELNEA